MRTDSVSRFLHRFTPRSLPGRFFLVMVALILATQVIVNSLWETQSRNDQNQALRDVAMNMALRVSATAEYFSSLPTRYRHVILNQLRDMGGTRYFVTLNREFIRIEPFQNTASHQVVLDVFRQTLEDSLTTRGEIQIAFSSPKTLKVFNNDTLLKDLPDSWGQESLLVKPLALPVLVIQIPVGEGEWLYLATLMPDSSLMNDERLSEPLKVSYMAWMLILMFIASLLIQKMTRPFEKLSMAAQTFGRNLEPVPVSEVGCREYETTAQAFNHMQKNIQHYMNDRKQLFSGISHDLKTPITRLRLRTELLDNDDERDAFNHDLDHLEMMVKSALQILSDTDIHENPEKISLKILLEDIEQSACSAGQQVQVYANCQAVINGKPLAMRRCLENLIGNAVLYGEQANVYLTTVKGCIDIRIRDKGPGLPDGMEEEVFKPYFRLEHGKSCNPDGNGLGLITARHLVNIHGGRLKLRNYPEGGLEVALELPEDKS
ncbi:MAG: ATP-binding protein [Endozoicomonas sp.]|uniref:ATP-binding protein n=1 Tax=Endozoicomonas sp. TaxID=1892382 RepID=UPI003D9B2539